LQQEKTNSISMTPYKHFSKNNIWQNHIRRGGIYVAVAALIGGQSACSNDNGSDWETVTVQEATKGVVTTLEETEPGQFSIIDEQVVASRDASRIIVRRLNGSVDTMSLAQAQSLVQPSDTLQPAHNTTASNHHHSHGMGSVIWWGAMGYMMGRNFSSPVSPGIYHGSYSNGFTRGSSFGSELRNTATSRTITRPSSSGRSGFFSRSRSGSSGG
jgi:hypothetical protein